MFASPGIRKDKRNDQELGEDATGFIYTHDYATLWIADGAPGTNIEFEGSNFNSRILAKCMGECFETVTLKDETPKMPLDEAFFREFIDKLEKKLYELLKDVDKCIRRNKDSLNLDEILEIKMNSKEKTYIITWSTTFVGAIIDIKNKVCYTMSMGDCIALVNDESVLNKYKLITGQANRLFVEWSIKANLSSSNIDISNSNPHFETTKSIDSIILMSDGVISYNDIENKFANKNVGIIWDELKLMNNRTDDDKTALFFNILEQR
jgi:hypothetical protein